MNPSWQLLVIVVVIGLVVGVAVWSVGKGLVGKTEIEWKFKDQSLQLDVAKDLTNPEAMFSKLLETEFARGGTLELLKKRNVFSLEESSFVEGLKSLCPDKTDPNETFAQRQERLARCFQKSPLNELRRLANDHAPPFQYIGKEVTVGTPRHLSEQPRRKFANVCTGSEFMDRKLQLRNPKHKPPEIITVQATGSYTCIGDPTEPDIQLNPQDAFSLFRRPTREHETAIAVVL
ncbi:MAG TPA: hypothetical protein VHM88_05420 [Candidatus Acidoferrales bacterium]|nr:hypothetical protein [Candidatus Acidoferrales bacterium]